MLGYLFASPNDDLLHTPDMPTRCEEHLRRILGTLLAVYSSLVVHLLYSGHEANRNLMAVSAGQASERRDLLDLKIGINGFHPSVV